MDPTTCLYMLFLAVLNNDPEKVNEHLEDYIRWRYKGGFPANVIMALKTAWSEKGGVR